jgi:hypothetical protein
MPMNEGTLIKAWLEASYGTIAANIWPAVSLIDVMAAFCLTFDMSGSQRRYRP